MTSATPVRDALHRLLGERMVESRQGSGFHLVATHEPDLRDLLDWNLDLLLRASRIRLPTFDVSTRPPLSPGPQDAIRELFHHIAAFSDNAQLIAAVDAASDRLGAVRAIEPALLDDLDIEVAGLADAVTTARERLVPRLRFYHRRRRAIIAQLVRALHRA